MHQSAILLLPSFAFPHAIDSSNYLALKDQSGVGSLSCLMMFQSISLPLQQGIRFS
jgi:hypothetical protein